ncbi:MAG: CoB--CoM heterodisulfide reductase iron-sulfur subunit B family protein, partial [Anaerolineae bacterium]
MQSYSYYPGCSLHGTAVEYDHSLKLVAGKLDLALHELADWNCCGATAAHSTGELLALALPARNLQIAARSPDPLLAPCAMCYNRMKVTQHALLDPARRAEIEQVLGGKDGLGQVQVLSILQALATPEMLAAVASRVVRPLKGLKVVCYYGCLLVRPPNILPTEDFENPQGMDRLVSQLGAEALDWPFKTECCGASLALARTDIVLKLGQRLLQMARQVGANCIVTACPMCHSNLDTRQSQIKARLGDDFAMPIFYITELMGLAFGYGPKELYIDKHLTDATGI